MSAEDRECLEQLGADVAECERQWNFRMRGWMRTGKTEDEAGAIVFEEIYKEFVLGRSTVPSLADAIAQQAQRAANEAAAAAQ